MIGTEPMTVEDFYAFTDEQPDEEKWELIDGELVWNEAPSLIHQWIVKNLVFALGTRERELKASWAVLPGLGVRVSDKDRPQPDVLIIPAEFRSLDPQERDTSDVIAAFEILSPSTEVRDLRWKRAAYTAFRRSRITSQSRRMPRRWSCSPAMQILWSIGSSRSTKRSSCARSSFRCR
jgi:Uma2 family endonuclease